LYRPCSKYGQLFSPGVCSSCGVAGRDLVGTYSTCPETGKLRSGRLCGGASPPRYRAPFPVCGVPSARQPADERRVQARTRRRPVSGSPPQPQMPLKQVQCACHMTGSSTGDPPLPGTGSVGALPCFLALAHLAAVRAPSGSSNSSRRTRLTRSKETSRFFEVFIGRCGLMQRHIAALLTKKLSFKHTKSEVFMSF
jgi:hypothetical protein